MNAKEIENECDYLAEMFGKEPDEETEEDLERRYKVVVMTVLPRLLGLARFLLFLLSPIAGFILLLAIKLLQGV